MSVLLFTPHGHLLVLARHEEAIALEFVATRGVVSLGPLLLSGVSIQANDVVTLSCVEIIVRRALEAIPRLHTRLRASLNKTVFGPLFIHN